MQVDPFALSEMATYQYAGNNPVYFNDPMGAFKGSDVDRYALMQAIATNAKSYAAAYSDWSSSANMGDLTGTNHGGGRGFGEGNPTYEETILLAQARAGNTDALREYTEAYGQSYEKWYQYYESVTPAGVKDYEVTGVVWKAKTSEPDPISAFDVRGIPNREAYNGFWGGVEYFFTGGLEDGVKYNRDGSPHMRGVVTGTAPDFIGPGGALKATRVITNLHHSFPKFLGGLKNQKLTKMAVDAHKSLHKEMNVFLSRFGMAPSKIIKVLI
jgi:hypothetical protein